MAVSIGADRNMSQGLMFLSAFLIIFSAVNLARVGVLRLSLPAIPQTQNAKRAGLV